MDCLLCSFSGLGFRGFGFERFGGTLVGNQGVPETQYRGLRVLNSRAGGGGVCCSIFLAGSPPK